MGLFNRKPRKPYGYWDWNFIDRAEWDYQNGHITIDEYEHNKELWKFMQKEAERKRKLQIYKDIDESDAWIKTDIDSHKIRAKDWKLEFFDGVDNMFRITCYDLQEKDVDQLDEIMLEISKQITEHYEEVKWKGL